MRTFANKIYDRVMTKQQPSKSMLQISFILPTTLLIVVSTAAPAVSVSLRTLTKNSQGLTSNPYTYFGPYHINGKRPECFGDFDRFQIGEEMYFAYDDQGNALVHGRLVLNDGSSYQLTMAKLIRSKTLLREGRGLFVSLVFTTETKEGINYSFEGQFLKEPKALTPGHYTDLEGVLTKFKDKEKAAEARLEFSVRRME